MCNLCRQIDSSRVDAFGDRLIDMLNQSGLSLMVSLGHRTGLFETMAKLPPANSETLATAADLNERYVREWLGAMTVGRIVDHDAATGTYHLPAEHAAMLTRDGAANLAGTMQFIPVLGQVEDQVLQCFKQGGGVPYSEYSRFHEVMAEDSGQTVVASLFDQILPIVPGMIERLEAGIDVLDLGCGRGRALATMAHRYPNSRFTGVDLSAEVIAWATEQARADGLANLTFVEADAASVDFHEAFDLVTTFDAIHDQARPDVVLANIRRALRPDGFYLMQDIRSSSTHAGDLDHPIGSFLYTVSTMHCMTVSLAAGGMGLGTMWGEKVARRMLDEAGFSNVKIHQLDHDFQNNYYVMQP